MMFFLDERGRAGMPTASYWGARILAQEWVQPGDETHELFPATADLKNSQGEQIVTAYAVHRPDGLWSLMLINKDPARAHDVSCFPERIANEGVDSSIKVVQFSGEQYQLGADREQPKPIKSDRRLASQRAGFGRRFAGLFSDGDSRIKRLRGGIKRHHSEAMIPPESIR
jgi:hypothetical protein